MESKHNSAYTTKVIHQPTDKLQKYLRYLVQKFIFILV